jgi:hypothetical protein
MKRVIEIDKIIEVPDDYIECSICGKCYNILKKIYIF